MVRPDLWTLTETGKYCPETICKAYRDSLDDCKRYCETNGARRLTVGSYNYCSCCTASSKLLMTDDNVDVYTLQGKYMYLPTKNW